MARLPLIGSPAAAPAAIGRRQVLAVGSLIGSAAVARVAMPGDGELGAESQTITGSMPWQDGRGDYPNDSVHADSHFFTAAESRFVVAAVDRLIPADATGPSGSEAGVPVFLDRQLAGSFGHGRHFFLAGPWAKGVPEQGYQSRFTPAQLYRAAISAIDTHVAGRASGKVFAGLAADEQEALLKELEAGKLDLGAVDGKAFFAMFLQNVKEGYFADPIYGGNRNMSAWRMIGFPGAHYDYSEWVKQHGARVAVPPVSLRGRPAWSV